MLLRVVELVTRAVTNKVPVAVVERWVEAVQRLQRRPGSNVRDFGQRSLTQGTTRK